MYTSALTVPANIGGYIALTAQYSSYHIGYKFHFFVSALCCINYSSGTCCIMLRVFFVGFKLFLTQSEHSLFMTASHLALYHNFGKPGMCYDHIIYKAKIIFYFKFAKAKFIFHSLLHRNICWKSL
jgi:hypothetical protein